MRNRQSVPILPHENLSNQALRYDLIEAILHYYQVFNNSGNPKTRILVSEWLEAA